MPSGPQSGKFGILHGGNPLAAITPIFNWTTFDRMALETYYASNTRMGPSRNEGVEDWGGSFSMNSGFPLAGTLPILPGTLLSGEFFSAPDTGIYGNTGTIKYGNFIVDSIVITWVFQPEASLTTVVNVSGHGKLQEKKGVIDDLSLLKPAKMCNLRVQHSINDGGDWIIWDNILQLVLTLTAANQPVVNSSTACATNRTMGNLDWTAVVTEQETEELFVKGADISIRIDNTPAPTFWELQWGKIREYSNFVTDRQTGQIISKDVNVDMNGIKGGALGHIIMPDTNKYWPPLATTVTTGFGGINEPPYAVS